MRYFYETSYDCWNTYGYVLIKNYILFGKSLHMLFSRYYFFGTQCTSGCRTSGPNDQLRPRVRQ